MAHVPATKRITFYVGHDDHGSLIVGVRFTGWCSTEISYQMDCSVEVIDPKVKMNTRLTRLVREPVETSWQDHPAQTDRVGTNRGGQSVELGHQGACSRTQRPSEVCCSPP